MQASVIITSYNQAFTLELLLVSLERQTVKDFEVIVADDGSKDRTAELCRREWDFPVEFIAQEDLGYRKSKILNQAIRHAKSDYLVFLDADVILEKHFIQDHLYLRTPGCFVCGRRVDLGPLICRKINPKQVSQGMFDGLSWVTVLSGLQKDSVSIKRGIRVAPACLRQILGYNRPMDILGSNLGAWKADIVSVNGFNEALESYWGEDGDLYIRLRNSGKTSIGAKGLCIQWHVFHPRRVPTQENIELYRKLMDDSSYKWAPKGYAELG